MPVMRSSKSTGERVNVAAHEGISYPPTSDVVQSGDQDESISQTSPTPPSPKELSREDKPLEPPINATDQDLKNAFQLMICIVASHGQKSRRFSCAFRSRGLNGQVLYITFGPTYVVLYRCILGELATIVIVICTVRTGCRLVLSGLLGIECLSVLLGIEA